MAFRVDRENGFHIDYPPGTPIDVRKHLHEKLDEVMAQTFLHGGAECRVTFTSGEHVMVLRLTLCDFTGEEICESCDGTGIKAAQSQPQSQPQHETSH